MGLEDWLGDAPAGTTITIGGDDDDPGSYSSADSYAFYQVRDFLQDSYDIGATSAGALVNQYGLEFYNQRGRWPAAWEMMQYDDFNSAASRIPTGADFLPDYFEMDGMFFANTPDVGPLPVPGYDPEMAFIRQAQNLEQIPGMSMDYLNRVGNFVPRMSQDQVLSILNIRAPSARGRGGGGGGGRRDPVFDKATIAESIRDLWRFYLKEEPEDRLDGIVNDYVRDATAFARQGGSLGLEAWTKGKLREEERYGLLYKNKPEHVDEAQWLGRYEQVAMTAGLRDMSVLRELERGASQGIGLAGFQQQVQRSPEVRAQGGFSRSLANTVAELGTMARV